MGLWGTARGWRWQSRTGLLKAGLGFLLLGLSLAQPTTQQPSCSSGVTPQNFTKPHYQNTAELDPGAGFMASLVQSFLHTVQPNPFPKDLILKIIEDSQNFLTNDALIKDILVYEIGFLVCAAIGIIYIVVMPIVGLFLMCCRCCGNCGGKMYQKQTPSIHCRRRTLYWCAFITTVIILAGNICMFKSNQAVKLGVDESDVQLNSALDNLEIFLTAVPQQLTYVFNQSYKTIDKISENLNGIGPQLASEIEGRLRKTLDPALQTVRLMNQDVVNTNYQLKQLNSSLTQLQSSVDTLQANITAVKSSITQTLSSPNCSTCATLNPDLQSLTMNISYDIPGLNEFQSNMDELMKADLESKIKEAEDYFNRMPQLVTNATEDTVQSINQELNQIKAQISQVTGDFTLNSLTSVSDPLDQARKEIVKIAPEAKAAERIRWIVCVVLCCVILLVVLCNLLGLVLGPLGLKPNSNPTKRSSTAHCGGTFLMMGAGFSFLVSWLFMLVVLLLFLLSGNAYSLLCKPWKNGELLKFIDDTPGLIPGLDSVNSTGLLSDLSIAGIYSDCKKNMPLWSVLHLDRLTDLGKLLNVSQYTEKIQQQFENTEINVPAVTLLSPEELNHLSSFSASAGSVDFTLIMQQINNTSSTNFNTTADKLDNLARVQTNADRKTELSNAAGDLRQIQANLETTVIPQLERLTLILESLRSTADRINGTVGGMLEKVKTAQDFLNTNTAQIVKAESKVFLDCQMGYIVTYVDWANYTITHEVGRCRPVAGTLDTAEIIICLHTVESLNAFWFSLGWCLIFFIPSIIFSIKLAKFYRRMKYSDVYDDTIIMSAIPSALK